jgi:hypothetical protein
MKQGQTGYRVGYRYKGSNKSVYFSLVHSPIIARLFKHNLVISSLIEVLSSTSAYRSYHFVYRSSRWAMRSGMERDGDRLGSRSITGFIEQLKTFDDQIGFVDDLFPVRQNTGKGAGRAPVAGNTFYLRLADKGAMLRSRRSLGFLSLPGPCIFACIQSSRSKRVPQRCLGRSGPAVFQSHANSLRFASRPSRESARSVEAQCRAPISSQTR